VRYRRLQSWFPDHHQHPNFWETKPRPKPQRAPMPKIPECDRCLLYARNPHLVCAVHPTGSDTDTCPDFRENPNAEPEELWEPEGASYYGGELILQPQQRWTRLATVRTAGHPPTIYRPVSSMRVPVPQVRNAPGALGLFGLRMDG